MRFLTSLIIIIASVFLPACRAEQLMNVVEFEAHLDEPYMVSKLFGLGFGSYSNLNEPSAIRIPGWKPSGIHSSFSIQTKLVYLGSSKVLLQSKSGEEHLLPLKWVGEVPPEQFNGKIFIRIYNLEEGLIHWKQDAFAHWDYQPEEKRKDQSNSQ